MNTYIYFTIIFVVFSRYNIIITFSINRFNNISLFIIYIFFNRSNNDNNNNNNRFSNDDDDDDVDIND